LGGEQRLLNGTIITGPPTCIVNSPRNQLDDMLVQFEVFTMFLVLPGWHLIQPLIVKSLK
jgi:hypothetical protein